MNAPLPNDQPPARLDRAALLKIYLVIALLPLWFLSYQRSLIACITRTANNSLQDRTTRGSASDATVGLRVDDEAERLGLDLSEHDENAYALEA